MADINVAAVPAARTPRASHLAFDLQTIKDDLGICGVENDAWLERRIAGAWARFEKYTSRYLCSPPAQFIDDWSRVVSTQHFPNQPPVLAGPQLGSPFLRCCPVVSVDTIRRGNVDGDPAVVRFEPSTGKLFDLGGAYAYDVSGELAQGQVRITYTAGWDEVPPDLYEALLGVLGVMWGQRSAQASGMGGGTVSSINVVDVGTVELGSADNSFVAATMKGVGTSDPMLGPWTYLLDPYVDYRVQIGSPLIPVTEFVGVTP